MYRWRNLNSQQRADELRQRRLAHRPAHSLPHHDSGRQWYLITAACYEHLSHIGESGTRLDAFSSALLNTLEEQVEEIGAWVVLPNHYHVIVLTSDVLSLLRHLGQLHGRTSFEWNGEENTRGRKVWCNAMERALLTDSHHYEALNYVHHNPVKHGYVSRWPLWKWSSASDYLAGTPREEAERLWRNFQPPHDFGTGWDD